ncbi:hypothetical protein MPTK1_4g09130 [Marchantia polymorpha subsp. ruderalis]|uniref:DUF538 family protein n=2 Tax=Marchantia polymorpha TaxID=3197 RepID=A0A176VI96_MARPO|nr:hypothetical protein AXG93_4794s1280 [Marchantia polymorpha subsp. ruderalis]PTQ31354.1 hypothetical protein MARPO_0112s0014 [Marchantia polymorpha]BBN08129.1 hypothetical protein Mp_4g09130 [Marchantia polymorpha subsp. ruderalis]|eukprot:PTQ31354.1 hypothetical protein MARPO_0112s0014 [Marchantia polymorpha]
MDQFLGSVGSYFFNQRAKKEMDSLGNDVNSVSTSVENFFSRLKGKVQKALPDLLEEYGLPRGLFPQNLLNYEYNETTGALVVNLPFPCEVGYRDQSVVRFDKRVTGVLRPGNLTDIEGMKTKIMFWVKVYSVSTEEDKAINKVHFQTTIKKTRAKDVYNYIRSGFEVDAF